MDSPCHVIDDAEAVAAAYAYELRSGEQIVSTGRLTAEHELGPGDRVTVADIVARRRSVHIADRGNGTRQH